MNLRRSRAVWAVGVVAWCAIALAGRPRVPYAEEPAASSGRVEEPAAAPADEGDQPVLVELTQGIELLNDQMKMQEELLKSAQTEREQQLIRNHIRALQKERRSLESLRLKLAGPY